MRALLAAVSASLLLLCGCESKIDDARRQQLTTKVNEVRDATNTLDDARRKALAAYQPGPGDAAKCELAMGIRQTDGTLDNFLLLAETTLGPLDSEERSFTKGAGLRKRLADKESDVFAARLLPGAEGVSERMASGYEASLEESVRRDFRIPFEINLILQKFSVPEVGADGRFVGGAYGGKIAVYSYPEAKVLCGAEFSGSFDGLTGVLEADSTQHPNETVAFGVLLAASRAGLKTIGIEGLPVVR